MHVRFIFDRIRFKWNVFCIFFLAASPEKSTTIHNKYIWILLFDYSMIVNYSCNYFLELQTFTTLQRINQWVCQYLFYFIGRKSQKETLHLCRKKMIQNYQISFIFLRFISKNFLWYLSQIGLIITHNTSGLYQSQVITKSTNWRGGCNENGWHAKTSRRISIRKKGSVHSEIFAASTHITVFWYTTSKWYRIYFLGICCWWRTLWSNWYGLIVCKSFFLSFFILVWM